MIPVIFIISYDMFPFLRYFSSWTCGASHHSGFKIQIVALFSLCASSLVQLRFVQNPLNAFVVFFPDISCSPSVTIQVAPMINGMTNFIFHIRW